MSAAPEETATPSTTSTPAASVQSPLRTLIFGTDKKQAIRISRFLMSTVAYLLSFCLLCVGYWLDVVDDWVILFGLAAITTHFCIFYIWLRSGLNLRMPDPSLTMIQMIVATLVILFMMYNADHVRGPFIIIYLVVFLFGIFRLSTQQFLGMTVFVLYTYGFMIYMLSKHHPTRINFYEDVLQWFALAALLPFFSFVAGHISSLRKNLRKSHDELRQAMDVIHDMAIRDELTGIYNRRHLMELLSIEKQRADRSNQPFCLVILDIDHFKRVNDTYGHLIGDQVIKATAVAIQNNLRSFDFCGRYGGEEFVLTMIQTTKEGALLCTERLRQHVEAQCFVDQEGNGFGVTISLGVTEYHPAEDIAAALQRADEALYRAKHGGRNRVEFLGKRQVSDDLTPAKTNPAGR